MHSAASTGDIKTMKILVEGKADLNKRNALLQTPMFLAAKNNHGEVVK